MNANCEREGEHGYKSRPGMRDSKEVVTVTDRFDFLAYSLAADQSPWFS